MKKSPASRQLNLALVLPLVALLTYTFYNAPTQAQPADEGGIAGTPGGGEPGAAASSPGSEGLPDTDQQYLKEVNQARKKGLKSRAYIGSLIGLGMHYNRQGKYALAQKTLSQALAIIDGGALKPTKGSVAEKPPTVTEHGDGTVSATINKPAAPYEETLEQLLPALVEADTLSNHLSEGEVHVKRLINMAQTERIVRVPNLMFAYNQYSALLTKMHRNKEAAHYKREAEKINSTIRGL